MIAEPESMFMQGKYLKQIGVVITVIMILIISKSDLLAQDSIKVKSWSVKGYVEGLQSVEFINYKSNWVNSNLIHNRLNFRWNPSQSILVAVELRNRMLYGNILTFYPSLENSFSEDNGFVNLSGNIARQQSFILNSNVDRMWIDYTLDHVELSIGRQRINWGETSVWNPNDIFNSYNYLDFDYEEKPGSDAVRFQYYTSSSSKLDFALKANKAKQLTTAGSFHFNYWNYDFQAMAGVVNNNDIVIGGGWSGQIIKGGFKGEFSYFHPRTNFEDTSGIVVASVGYDYSFKNSFMLQAECLYNGNNTSVSDSSFSILSSFHSEASNPFLSGFSFFSSAVYPFTPLFKGSLSVIASPIHNLAILIPSVEYSLAENLDLSLLSQILITSYQLDTKPLKVVFLRIKWSF
jgi:hypothetical protein